MKKRIAKKKASRDLKEARKRLKKCFRHKLYPYEQQELLRTGFLGELWQQEEKVVFKK